MAHLQKCYTERTNEIAQRECAKFYINREFDLIKPTLDLVIVLGDMAKEFIQNQFFYIRNKSKYKWCFAPIPKTGEEEEFVFIRKELSKHISGIDERLYHTVLIYQLVMECGKRYLSMRHLNLKVLRGG